MSSRYSHEKCDPYLTRLGWSANIIDYQPSVNQQNSTKLKKNQNNYIQCIPVPDDDGNLISYNKLVAQDVGSDAAAIYKFIVNAIRGSKKANCNIAPYKGDDYYWCYCSLKSLSEKWFPHMAKETIRRNLKTLEKKKYIVSKKGGFNAHAYDKTTWYTIIQPEVKVNINLN